MVGVRILGEHGEPPRIVGPVTQGVKVEGAPERCGCRRSFDASQRIAIPHAPPSLHVGLHRARHVPPGDGTVHRNGAGIIRSNEGTGRAKPARLYSSNQRHAHSDSLRPPRRVRREHHPPVAAGPELIILAGHLAPVHTRRVGDIARRWTSADRTLYVPGGRQGGDASQRAIGRAPAQRRIRPPAQGQTNPRTIKAARAGLGLTHAPCGRSSAPRGTLTAPARPLAHAGRSFKGDHFRHTHPVGSDIAPAEIPGHH